MSKPYEEWKDAMCVSIQAAVIAAMALEHRRDHHEDANVDDLKWFSNRGALVASTWRKGTAP